MLDNLVKIKVACRGPLSLELSYGTCIGLGKFNTSILQQWNGIIYTDQSSLIYTLIWHHLPHSDFYDWVEFM